jgi:hypothetical protein
VGCLRAEQGFLQEIYIIFRVFTGVGPMKKKLFIVPGYLVGIGGVLLITYQTLLAFFSEDKSISIQVNRYGEQYGDIVVLVFLWVVCVVGLVCLVALLRDPKDETVSNRDFQDRAAVEEKGLFLGRDQSMGADEKSAMSIGALGGPFIGTYPVFPSLGEKETRCASSVSFTVLQGTKNERIKP